MYDFRFPCNTWISERTCCFDFPFILLRAMLVSVQCLYLDSAKCLVWNFIFCDYVYVFDLFASRFTHKTKAFLAFVESDCKEIIWLPLKSSVLFFFAVTVRWFHSVCVQLILILYISAFWKFVMDSVSPGNSLPENNIFHPSQKDSPIFHFYFFQIIV